MIIALPFAVGKKIKNPQLLGKTQRNYKRERQAAAAAS
jgi:hypothetical protein